MIYICVWCGVQGFDLAAMLNHSVTHFQPRLTAIEKEALIAIEDRVKRSPEYQEHYMKEVA